MARDPLNGIDTAVIREYLTKAQTALMSGQTFISGGAGDVTFSKFREVPLERLVNLLQRSLAIRGEPDFPAADYIGTSVLRPDFSGPDPNALLWP